MREIRFRAWKNDVKFMNYSVRIDTSLGETTYEVAEGLDYILVPKECVMQYTGLKDKNGVEIYGSDIVLMYGEDKFIVHFDYDKACYFLWSTTDMNDVVYFGDFVLSDVEVIGNIHDNPELLEKEGKDA